MIPNKTIEVINCCYDQFNGAKKKKQQLSAGIFSYGKLKYIKLLQTEALDAFVTQIHRTSIVSKQDISR